MSTLIWMLAVLAWQQPQDVKDVMNEGVAEFKAGRYEPAATLFERAVELDPNNANAHLYLGTAYLQLYIPGAPSPENVAWAGRAEDQFKRVLELQPRHQVALASLTSLEYNRKQYDAAIEWNRLLLGVNPSDKDAHYWAGVLVWQKFYPALNTVRAREKIRSGTPGPLRLASDRKELLDQYGAAVDGAIAHLRRAIEIYPQYADAMSYLNLLIRERADLRETEDEYRRDIAEADQLVESARLAMLRWAELNSSPTAGSPARVPAPTPPRIRIAEMNQDRNLTHRVDPVCSALATDARISGEVKFTVTIGKDGVPNNIQVISGHPLLIPAALESVKQRVYKPTLLKGAPAEVLTTATLTMNCVGY